MYSNLFGRCKFTAKILFANVRFRYVFIIYIHTRARASLFWINSRISACKTILRIPVSDFYFFSPIYKTQSRVFWRSFGSSVHLCDVAVSKTCVLERAGELPAFLNAIHTHAITVVVAVWKILDACERGRAVWEWWEGNGKKEKDVEKETRERERENEDK